RRIILPGFVRCSDLPAAEPVDWLVPGWLAKGKVHLLVGEPGLGKSTWTLDLVARLTRGEPLLPDAPAPPPQPAVIVQPEDGLRDTIVPRLVAAGADLEQVLAFQTENEAFELPRHASLLREQVGQDHAGLVIIDPLTAIMATALSINNQQDVRQILQPLVNLGQATGAAIIVCHHLNKSATASPTHRIAGSTAVVAVSRIALLMGQHPDDADQRVISQLKTNLAKLPRDGFAFCLDDVGGGAARIRHLGACEIDASDLVAPSAAASAARPGELEKATMFALTHLDAAGGEMPTNALDALAQQSGISKGTLIRALKGPAFGKRKHGKTGPWLTTLAAPKSADEMG
ncbi:MAG TPA: AAA family ATPase, partial [Thermomicrobiales bacterium]|nr:AAA family ATPase [Thermomicrobiales bacterium]